jgi:hypothetical protein
LPLHRRADRTVRQRAVGPLDDPADGEVVGHGLLPTGETPPGDARRHRPAVDADADDVLDEQVSDRTATDAANTPQLARTRLSAVVDRHPRAVVEGPEAVAHGRQRARAHVTPSPRARVAGTRDAGSTGEPVQVRRSPPVRGVVAPGNPFRYPGVGSGIAGGDGLIRRSILGTDVTDDADSDRPTQAPADVAPELQGRDA